MDTGCSAALDSERLTFSICWDRNIIYLQDCSFVGLDISRRQPDLVRTRRDDLSDRVKWVHANLYVGYFAP